MDDAPHGFLRLQVDAWNLESVWSHAKHRQVETAGSELKWNQRCAVKEWNELIF